jgi:hypothetical protein
MIFSAPMVRALLDGRKTQTRPVVKNVPDAPAMDNIVRPDEKLHPAPYVDAYCGALRTPENPRGMTENWAYWTRDDRPGPLFKVGYVPGDRIWVRESLRMGFDAETPICQATYAADGAPLDLTPQCALIWAQTRTRNAVASNHMPRWASRLTLLVTDVRVQRLQDISNEDARAEFWWGDLPDDQRQPTKTATGMFRYLWNSLHGPDAWDANPWVCAISFDVIKGNIDEMRGK